jgi:NNP family nitrate/nitrite transporter-like MFS transporter
MYWFWCSVFISLGIGIGGVFGWVTQRVPAGSLGAVAGIVSTIGGLGGYFPPLAMGASYDPVHNNYTVDLLFLVTTTLIAGIHTAVRL